MKSIVLCCVLCLSAVGQAGKGDDISKWKLFASRAGWSIRYPRQWKVSSCHSCTDLTDPNAFVAIENPKADEIVMIDRLVDKPSDQGLEEWLKDVKLTTNLNPKVSEVWITLGNERALMVITRNPDSTECENYYVVHGSKTFAIQIDRNSATYPVYKRMLNTFKFTN